MNQELIDCIGDIHRLKDLIKSKFVAKDQLVEMLTLCAVAHEHILVVGPPGTAKSELVKRFALSCCMNGHVNRNGTIPYFEYLLTRFTEPNEIFGPINVKAFENNEGYLRNTEGYLPRAEIAFLDEVFKSNSAILNALLNVLNERIYYNGSSAQQVPLLCAIGATNEIPDDTTLSALYDRFLVRLWTDNVEDSRFEELIGAGWDIEKEKIMEGYQIKSEGMISTDHLRKVHNALNEVDLSPVMNSYHEAIRRIRSEGIEVSDRRAIKLLKLIASAALMRRQTKAATGDFWILSHIWNNPEQIPHLQAIIEPYLEGSDTSAWKAERDLKTLDGLIHVVEMKQPKTDADYKDFLQECERLRNELYAHSDKENAQPLVQRLERSIDASMKRLDALD